MQCTFFTCSYILLSASAALDRSSNSSSSTAEHQALLHLDAATVNVDELLLRTAAASAKQELLAIQARLGGLLQEVGAEGHAQLGVCMVRVAQPGSKALKAFLLSLIKMRRMKRMIMQVGEIEFCPMICI